MDCVYTWNSPDDDYQIISAGYDVEYGSGGACVDDDSLLDERRMEQSDIIIVD